MSVHTELTHPPGRPVWWWVSDALGRGSTDPPCACQKSPPPRQIQQSSVLTESTSVRGTENNVVNSDGISALLELALVLLPVCSTGWGNSSRRARRVIFTEVSLCWQASSPDVTAGKDLIVGRCTSSEEQTPKHTTCSLYLKGICDDNNENTTQKNTKKGIWAIYQSSGGNTRQMVLKNQSLTII